MKINDELRIQKLSFLFRRGKTTLRSDKKDLALDDVHHVTGEFSVRLANGDLNQCLRADFEKKEHKTLVRLQFRDSPIKIVDLSTIVEFYL